MDQSTIVITTVHESQIVSDEVFSQNLQTSHDLPVDIIITPRKIINVKPKNISLCSDKDDVVVEFC